MPAAAAQGDLCVVHCTLPVVGSGSPNVYINKRPAAKVGDKIIPHLQPGSPSCVPCTSAIGTGSSTVFINKLPAAYVGSKLVACTSIATGSPNVFYRP